MIQTTTDCVKVANVLMEEAKQVTTWESFSRWWDKKVDILLVVNNALETGGFTGMAYDELWEAKNILYFAEEAAGRAHQRFMKL